MSDKTAPMYKDDRNDLLKELLPDGNKFDVIPAYSRQSYEQFEAFGYHFIGECREDDGNFFWAFLKLKGS